MIRFFLILLVFIVLFFPLFPLLLHQFYMHKKDPEKQLWQTMHILQTAVSICKVFSGVRLHVEGLENIPEDQAVLFVGNHRSDFDILCTYPYLKRPTGFVAKKEMKNIPVLGYWLDLMGSLALDRKDVKQGLKTILKAIEYVKNGQCIMIYPEGTRNRNPDPTQLMEFKEGSLKIAEKAKCPIIPVAICGTDDLFENHKPFVRPADAWLRFGKPFYTADIPEEYRKRPAAYTREVISEMLKDMGPNKETD